MGKNYKDTLNKQLEDSEFKAEWDSLETEFQIISAIIEGRKKKNITQKELSEITGITQSDIRRL